MLRLTPPLFMAALLALCLPLSACDRAGAPPAKSLFKDGPAASSKGGAPDLHRVVEQFEVGSYAYVRSLSVQGDQLYVGTSVGVLQVDRKKGDMVRTYTAADGMRDPYAFVVKQAPDGALWMGTNAGGLSIWRDEAMHNYLPKHGLADLWVYDVAFTPEATWLGTWDGVNRIGHDLDNKADWTTYNVKDGLANPWVYAIQVDQDGAVWFGTEGGLSRLHKDQWTTWRHGDGLGAPNPSGLKSRNMSGFGSSRDGSHSHNLTTLEEDGSETYNEDYVFSLLFDNQGRLWIGTWGGGASRFDGQTFTNFTQSDGLAGNVVYAIAQGPDGAMWFGTNHGLSRYDGTVWQSYGMTDQLIGEDVYAVTVDEDNVVWAGQKGGVSKLMSGKHPVGRRSVPPHNPAPSPHGSAGM